MACGRTIGKTDPVCGSAPCAGRARRSTWYAFIILALVAAFATPGRADADPIKAKLDVSVSGGYARLVFDMGAFDDANVRLENSVLIINFKQPLDVSVERLAAQAPGYIGAARRDPDGRAIRLALARKVKVNAMIAGEKYFVDLLPDTWTGELPGLPPDVIADLTRRAREAERLMRREHQMELQKKTPPVRVHVATQPTFTRYVFDIPGQTSVTADRTKDQLMLRFDAPLRFDLADAVASLPRTVGSIAAKLEDDSASVRFGLPAKADVRTFRDDKGYVVDIVDIPAESGQAPANGREAAVPPAVLPAAALPPAPVVAAPPAVLPAAALPPAPADAAKAAPAVAAQSAPLPPTQVAPAPAVPAPTHKGERGGKVVVDMTREGVNLKLSFAFASQTAAAIFHRADTLWIVFDSKADIDLSALEGENSRTIRSAELTRAPDADIVRLKLDRPRLSSIAIDGPVWTVEIGDSIIDPTRALDLTRNMIGRNRASVTIPFDKPQQLHRIVDPEIGDSLLVVTAFGPARGFIKTQDFIEFRALASTQGVVVQPIADDVNVELAADKIVISRPNGLTLSSALQAVLRGNGLRPVLFDSQLWGFDRDTPYVERQSGLMAAAAAAPKGNRMAPRLDLARFYLARDMYPEAKGVLDVVLADDRPAAEDVSATVLRAVAEVMMNRPQEALKDLADPAVGNEHDAPLWRALAWARQGKWAQARAAFKTVDASMATLPVELQRVALKDEMRAAIEVGDYAGAESNLNDFETIGLPHDMQPAMSVLIGRLAEGLGRNEDALTAYRTAADSWDRPAAAQGRLREIVLRYKLGELKRDDVVSQLESLTTIWRGDETEIEALQILARLYTAEARYRDSFYVMRSAMTAHPNSDMTRRIQEEAAATFESLFLSGKGDALPAVDALALFYDFRELTPIGRRGDEMIRRLADRLVAVDLLDQAADLLQYQVDHRLQGAARAQVATRLAVIYLMNRKSDQALAILRSTRTADLSTELRDQRLLLEARALSDVGRHDVALEVIANVSGHEAIRLRSDILWAASRWRESAEQIELMYGERWKDWQPLNDAERSDILRAEIGYALAEDTLGLGRFRDKYAAKMAQTPDARAFEVVSAPLGTSGDEFKDIAHAAAAVDTLDAFLRDMKARFPESSAMSSPIPANAAPPALPAAPTDGPALSSKAPATQLQAPVPPRRAAGRTAQR
jgi:tetratricopeptide (TPR) repeat protein